MAQERRFRLTDRLPRELGPSDVAPNHPNALSFLTEAEVLQGWLMPNASNYTFLVELCWDNEHGYGIYKPQTGEAPLRDFPTGTLYRRECAAYAASQWLGWSLVPPTVQRTGELGIGSLQLYVPPLAESHYFVVREEYPAEALRMGVFDIVVNNADRKAGHCFEAQTGGIWGIDHGLTFHVAPKLRTVIWDFGGQRVPASLLGDLRGFAAELATAGSEAVAELKEWTSFEEVQALSRRIDALLSEPVMPEPNSRRDLPWPWF